MRNVLIALGPLLAATGCYDDRLTSLEAEIESQGNDQFPQTAPDRVAELETQVAALSKQIDALETNDATQDAALTNQGASIATQSERIEALETNDATQDAALTNQGASIAALEQAVDGLETDTSTLGSDLTALTTRVTSTESDILNLDNAVILLDTELQGSKVAARSQTFSSTSFLSGSDVAVRTMASMAVNVPGPGRLIVILDGYVITFGQNRDAFVGIGDTSTAFDYRGRIGHLDGSSTLRDTESFSVAGTFTVTEGPRTFYALYQGTSFDNDDMNIVPRQMTAIWVPEAL